MAQHSFFIALLNDPFYLMMRKKSSTIIMGIVLLVIQHRLGRLLAKVNVLGYSVCTIPISARWVIYDLENYTNLYIMNPTRNCFITDARGVGFGLLISSLEDEILPFTDMFP